MRISNLDSNQIHGGKQLIWLGTAGFVFILIAYKLAKLWSPLGYAGQSSVL
jgi:hypothetical protein